MCIRDSRGRDDIHPCPVCRQTGSGAGRVPGAHRRVGAGLTIPGRGRHSRARQRWGMTILSTWSWVVIAMSSPGVRFLSAGSLAPHCGGRPRCLVSFLSVEVLRRRSCGPCRSLASFLLNQWVGVAGAPCLPTRGLAALGCDSGPEVTIFVAGVSDSSLWCPTALGGDGFVSLVSVPSL